MDGNEFVAQRTEERRRSRLTIWCAGISLPAPALCVVALAKLN